MSQSDPIENKSQPHIADRVIDDIRERKHHGILEYGVPLQARNGRRALQDMYEELLDGAHYVRQRIDEEDLALAAVSGDQAVRPTLDAIYSRAERWRKRPVSVNGGAAVAQLTDDIGYLRQTVEALLLELWLRNQTPDAPPAGTEVARYQYRAVGPDGKAIYDDESYDQDCIDEWCDDPEGWSQGYYPEYRPLYGGQWYRVDPENPPGQPESSGYGPAALETPPVDEKGSEALREPLGGGGAGLPTLFRQVRLGARITQRELSDRTGLPLSTVIQLQNYYVPVDGHVAGRWAEACKLDEDQTELLVGLALATVGAECRNSCGHAMGQHVRSTGCMRCQCRAGLWLD